MRQEYPTDEESMMEQLSDDQILAICAHQLTSGQQLELATLLEQQREGEISTMGRVRLDVLLNLYQQGSVQKAQALAVAVAKGLLSSLDQH